MSSTKPTVLIVGASFGGLGCAGRLLENGGSDKFNIILVETKDWFTIGGLWQFVWTNRLTMDQIVFSLKDANLPGIDVRLKTKIVKWNVNEKQVILEDASKIPYDYIVMACGIVPDAKPIPGIENHVNICSFDTVSRQQKDARDLLQQAKSCKQTFVLAIGDVPYKCPPAPFELTFMLDEMLTKAGVRDNVRMVITCPIDWPMPHPQSPEMFQKEMQSRNIEYLPMHEMVKVEKNTVHYKNDVTLEASLLWTVYPIRAPDFIQEALPTNDKGTITVDNVATNTISNVKNAYAIGDCCRVEYDNDITVPKAGEFAWKMGVSVADALVSGETPTVDRLGACVAEIGFGKGIELRSDFSDATNKKGEQPDFHVGESTQGEAEKVAWVNSYLKRIFGDKAETLELSSKEENESRKRQKVE